MRRVIFLATAATLLAGYAGTAGPSGIWINRAVIDVASKDDKPCEALLVYDPNLEWELDNKVDEATLSNGLELSKGTLSRGNDEH